jgi:hypothetical protein
MTQADVQALFQKFAAPLAPYVTSAGRQRGAEMLARTLWQALILGPEMEAATWKALKDDGKIADDLIEAIRQCYTEKMKPVVNEEQLAVLRQRYEVQGK